MANSCIDCDGERSIPQTEILYSQGEPTPKRLRRHIRLPEPVSGYALYPCDDELETGFYLVCPQSAVNSITNPTFYVDLDGWSSFNAQVSRTNELAFDSGFSLKINGSGDSVTVERRAYSETEVTSFVPGQPYTFTMYAWTPIIWDVSDPIAMTISIVDDLGNEIFSEPLSKAQQWQRLTVSTIIDLNATQIFLRVNLRSQDQQENQPPHDPTGLFNLASEYVYFDMAQFEFGSTSTTPFHGDTNTCATCDHACSGYQWSGIAHKSSSTRSDCVRDGGKLVCLTDLGFNITSHTGHGAPPIRDISFPLNNRPGEFYQKSVADARVLTLTGQLCETTLKDLECAIYGLGQKILPDISPCSCCGQFLLVYHHGECDKNECDTERDLALCVTYIGGLEGNRTNHYNQIASLQFKAHDPFWFEFPGQKSASIDFVDVVTTPNVVSINSDGTVRGFDIDGSNTYSTIACFPGINSVAIGGTFESINGDEDRCEENVAIWNCDEWLDLCFGFVGGGINQMTPDGQGNILVAGSFSGPCNNIAIIYQDGTIGCFSGYPGGEAYAIAAPFYAQVVVGDDTGIHAQDFDGNWFTFATNGRVTDFAIDAAGNMYAVGEFTIVDGVETGNVVFLNVNVNDCPDLNSGQAEAIGFTFNGTINSVDINKSTGTVYLGGAFTEATPLPVDICQVSDDVKIDSNGSNQIIDFSLVAGTTYRLTFSFLNIVTRDWAEYCLTNGNYLRITGQSSFGTTYNLLVGTHNATPGATATVVIGADTFYTLEVDVDTSLSIGDPCETLDTALIEELDFTNLVITTYTNLTLPGGTGNDNTLTKLSAQCVEISDSFQGDTVTLNYVAELSGNNITPMGNGLDSEVNVIAVNPVTGEVWAGTTNSLNLWNGLAWFDFAGSLGGSEETEVLDIKFCDNGCETLILFNSANASILPGVTSVGYTGDVSPNMELVIHGPGEVQLFQNNDSGNKLNLCTILECNEIATLDFNTGSYSSNFRDNLSPSVLGGSRYDICMSRCGENNFSLYITDDEATTKATLLWRDRHYGIEALCCKATISSAQLVGTDQAQAVQVCTQTDYLMMHRAPTNDDCIENGVLEGTIWVNHAAPDCGVWINTGQCEDCDEFQDGYVGDEGATLQNDDGENYCPDDDIDCDTFD